MPPTHAFGRLASYVFRPFMVGLAVIPLVIATSRGSDAGKPKADDKSAAQFAPPKVSGLRFEHGPATLVGLDSRFQLQVAGKNQSGREFDLTRAVTYQMQPAGVVAIDDTGYVRPVKDGKVEISAKNADGQSAKTTLTVTRANQAFAPGFHRRVMPILDKYGCTSCHGTPRGQNGFKLSLFGFDPKADYRALVKELGGRRVSLHQPAQSLVLAKATAQIPHGGAKRFAKSTDAYTMLHGWIASGVPFGDPEQGNVSHIEVLPANRILDPGQTQQLRVIAHYKNGDVDDVTRLAKFHSNDEVLASVSNKGVVKATHHRGDFAITVSLRDSVGVFRGTIPYGHDIEKFPAPTNFIDEHVFARLKFLGMPPSKLCTDREFIRRVTIDIAGRLPTLDELKKFDANQSPNKRDALIDRLLASDDYANYFANKWCSILRNHQAGRERKRGSFSFHNWVVKSFRDNKPYDQFVREILTASGDVTQNPPATWYQEVITPQDQVENLSQLFMGVRITCARCHHHPFERWSQKDYYSLAAFFSQVGRKQNIHGDDFYEQRIYHKRGLATFKHPNTGEVLKPTVLGGKPLTIAVDDDPRQKLADWLVHPSNPFFAKVLVNRYWSHFFGRGIVDPVDDMRDTNPPSNPELLDALRKHFVESNYDLKALVREICRSKTYQLSTQPNQHNVEDDRCFSRFQPRRLHAEVLMDAIDQLSGTKTRYSGMPTQVRAVELPDSSTGGSEFLELFGRPKAGSPCECERSQESDLRQSLYLLTSSGLQGKVASGGSIAHRMANDKRSEDEKINELYLRAFARPATNDEKAVAKQFLKAKSKDLRKAYAGLVWALLNTKEFMYNH